MRITIELKPMLGRVAVAPRGEEAFGGLWPGDFGDGHARQGHGELDGTGLEASTVANIVDPNYTVLAKFPKRYLPRRP